MGKCSFKSDWLLKNDGKGYKISDWGSKHSESEAFCNVCVSTINIEKKGFQALVQHASSSKHQEACHIKLEPNQLHLASVPSSVVNSCSNAKVSECIIPNIKLYRAKDNASTAELIWILKCVVSNFSATSTDGIDSVFKAMFPGAVPEGFSLSRTKVNYILTEALLPYFKKELINDIEDNFYTLCFDETTNASSHKELQTTICYWSNKQNKVVNHHLQTFFMGEAKGEDIFEKLKTAIDTGNLSLCKLLMLGSDGPNVNKKVFRLMNEEMMIVRKQKLVNMGFCNIHILHNAFKKGLSKLGTDSNDLIIALYNFFDGWPSRWEGFTEIQEKLGVRKHHFIKHCPSRWLTIEDSAARVIEQWEAINHYFFKCIPMKVSSLMSTNAYKLIVKLLKVKTIKAELLFVCSSAHLFTRFTGTFQKDEPLIHLLYDVVENLLQTLIGRVCKNEKEKVIEYNEKLFESKNLLPLSEIVVSEEVKLALEETSENDRLIFLKMAQSHYIEASKFVIDKGPISNHLVKHFRFLKPNEISSKRSVTDIVAIAKALPLEIPHDKLIDEWKLIQLENKSDAPKTNIRIDQYWSHFLTMQNAAGMTKYPLLNKLIKCSLCLSHGNAYVERGFSSSSKVLTEDRSQMSERTLNSYLTVKDALKLYNNKPELVPITKSLITLAQGARKSYQNYLDETKRLENERIKRKKEENEVRKKEAEVFEDIEQARKTIDYQEKGLKQKLKEEAVKHKTAKKIFEEASARLHKAVEKKDFEEINIANAMLIGYSKMQKEEESTRKEVKNLQENLERKKTAIEKRKSSLITQFFNKKPKL